MINQDRDLTIAAAGTTSAVFAVSDGPALMEIGGPSALAETVYLEQSRTETGTYTIAQDAGVDVILAAGRTQRVIVGDGWFRLRATGAAAAARSFHVHVCTQ